MRLLQPEHIPREFDDRALHAKADAEEWNAAFSYELDGVDFSVDAARSEAGRDQHAIEVPEFGLHVFLRDAL